MLKNMKDINEKIIRISGSFNTDKKLELGDDVEINLNGGVIKIEYKDNQDGTMDEVIIVKVLDGTIKK